MNAVINPEVLSVKESSDEDLAYLRWALDLALQPLDEFAGFTRMEQIGSSAYRYQLNFVCYALAMSQFTRTPAFTGYLAEAQRNCIMKMCDKRVWGYWAWENLLGNARWNPDPIAYQNVMYTGFFGVMLGMYESLNEDRPFSEEGALTLHWSRRKKFPYDFERLTAAIRHNMEQSRYTQYACEPHLVYPMCNTFALNTLHMHDRLHGTHYGEGMVERVEQSYQQFGFLQKNGRFLGGMGPARLRFPEFISNDAIVALWLHGVMPQQTKDSWDLVRNQLAPLVNGRLGIEGTFVDRIDFGNYRMNGAWLLSFLMALAKEMGDTEYANAAEAMLSEMHESVSSQGASMLKGVSNWANANHVLARFLEKGALAQLIRFGKPDAWKKGPVLSAAPYPDVLVAKAVSEGESLELVLLPGDGEKNVQLRLSGLCPRAEYSIDGPDQQELRADEKGEAIFAIRLPGKVNIIIRPAECK